MGATISLGCGRRFKPVFVCLVILVGLLATGNARADIGSLAFEPASTAAAVPPPAGIGTAPTPPGASPGQASSTDQTSLADAAVTKPQQSNVVVVIRINSPGDDNISQTNVISVGATSSNDSSTNQNQGPTAAQVLGDSASPQARQPNSSGEDQPTSAPAPTSIAQPASAPAVAQPASAPAVAQPASAPAPAADPGRGRMILAAYARSSAGSPPRAAAARSRSTHSSAVAGSRVRISPASVRTLGRGRSVVRSSVRATAHATAAVSSTQSSSRLALGSPRPNVATGVVGGGRSAASQPLAADSGNDSNLAVLTLAALLTGLLAWAAVTWLPQTRRLLGRIGRG